MRYFTIGIHLLSLLAPTALAVEEADYRVLSHLRARARDRKRTNLPASDNPHDRRRVPKLVTAQPAFSLNFVAMPKPRLLIFFPLGLGFVYFAGFKIGRNSRPIPHVPPPHAVVKSNDAIGSEAFFLEQGPITAASLPTNANHR